MGNVTHLGNSDQITTVNQEEVVFTTAEGKLLKMKVNDLANVIKSFIPTFGYFWYYPIGGDRWKKVLDFDCTHYGEFYASFLFTGGSYTNSESCCIIINIMIGATTNVCANRIAGNGIKGGVNIVYKYSNGRLQIWMQGTYSANGSALINLSAANLPFKNTAETPPIEAINVPII